ncbi:DUF1700 domain-containing protein, partial [Aquifex sp.]
MKKEIILLTFLLSSFGFPREDIREIVEKVKTAPPEERYIYMNELKLRLRELKEEQREEIIKTLYREFGGRKERSVNPKEKVVKEDEKERETPSPKSTREVRKEVEEAEIKEIGEYEEKESEDKEIQETKREVDEVKPEDRDKEDKEIEEKEVEDKEVEEREEVPTIDREEQAPERDVEEKEVEQPEREVEEKE